MPRVSQQSRPPSPAIGMSTLESLNQHFPGLNCDFNCDRTDNETLTEKRKTYLDEKCHSKRLAKQKAQDRDGTKHRVR